MSRKIEDLTPSMQEKAKEFQRRMEEAGLPFVFTCLSSPAPIAPRKNRMNFGSRGRSKPGPKVTWTIFCLATRKKMQRIVSGVKELFK